MKCIVDGDVVLSRPLEGPLSAHIAAFTAWARQQGYALRSRYRQVLLAACFSRWLGQQAVSVRAVSAENLAQYLRSRARRVQIHSGDAAALRQFLEFLRRESVIPAEKMAPCRLTPVEQETQAFETYLRNERALAETTLVNYVPLIRGFLMDRFGNGRATLSRLGAGDVVRFVQRQAPRLHQKRAKLLTTANDSNYYSLPLGWMAKTEAPPNQERRPRRTDERGERRAVAETVGREGHPEESGNLWVSRWGASRRWAHA